MSSLFTYWEHFNDKVGNLNIPSDFPFENYFLDQKDDEGSRCIGIFPKDGGHQIKLSYFIGVDWIIPDQCAVYVEPKLNEGEKQTNFLQMLFSGLKHPGVSSYTDELFEIKFDQPYIEITQQQDMLTPLLVVQFLRVTKEIVRKGLKKSYYKVERNLQAKIKGKVLVAKTIKHNILKNKTLNTYCSYDEFGLNGLENRLLKKTVVFIQRYLPTLKIPNSTEYTTEIFNYINPAFNEVSEEVSLNDIKHSKANAFYKEYQEAIRLAKLILRRFGYNITNTQQQNKIKTPPFWIDMSKLFELYVLGLLKDRFKKATEVKYHFRKHWNELDYLICTEDYKMVVDAKYKIRYKKGSINDDIRQVSGYARLKPVYDELGKNYSEIIDCLIVYPDQENGHRDFKDINFKATEIHPYVQFYKAPVKLPVI